MVITCLRECKTKRIETGINMAQKEWTAEKFEPAEEHYEIDTCYCVYCFAERNDRLSCCGENHFMTGKELLEREHELDAIDRQRKGASE